MKKLLIIFLIAVSGTSFAQSTFIRQGTTTGTSTVYTSSITGYPTTGYINGGFIINFDETNGNAPTLNINSNGAKALRKWDGSAWVALTGSELVAGSGYISFYNGTYFEVTLPNSGGGTTYTSSNGIVLTGTDFGLEGDAIWNVGSLAGAHMVSTYDPSYFEWKAVDASGNEGAGVMPYMSLTQTGIALRPLPSSVLGGGTAGYGVYIVNGDGTVAIVGRSTDPTKFLRANTVGAPSWETPSGGGGSGTVSTGVADRLAYYAASGTTVDDLAAITANRALISDANGLPTHATTTATEIGYVNGVTSAIQTQLGGKQSTITFGTGVQTALGVNVGSAGAPVLLNGAGGTPSAINLSNGTALPGTSVVNTPAGNIAATNSQAAINELDTEKQSALVSGTSIKTVNSTSLLGSGDVDVIDDAIVNGVTTVAPSQNAVFDALALKAPYLDQVSASTAGGTITLDFDGLAERTFRGSASVSSAKILAITDTSAFAPALTFYFLYTVTGTPGNATLQFPTNFTSEDTRFSAHVFTPSSAVQYTFFCWKNAGTNAWKFSVDPGPAAAAGGVTSVTGNGVDNTSPAVPNIQTASATLEGTTKLYTSTGSSTDGTMDRNSITTAIAAKQDLDGDLTSIAGNTTGGFLTRTASNTYTPRTITGTTDQVTVTNGDGVSGNPTLSIPSTYSPAAVKKRLGNVVDVTPGASSGSLYTSTSPTSTFTFTSGGITTSGADQTTPTNYLQYTGYYTNVFYFTREILVDPTTDGAGAGLGLHSGNGDTYARFNMTGVNKGKLTIETYRSSTVTTRATSTSALSYSNTGDVIRVIYQKNLMNYRVTAYIVGTPSGAVSVEWTDDLAFSTVSSSWAAARSTIYHFGGAQTITYDRYTVEEYVQNDVVIISDSEGAGAYASGSDNMYFSWLKRGIPNGVSLIAGGGNKTSDWTNLKTEVFALKPKIAVYALGINDVINSVSSATTQANILGFVTDCYAAGITPIVCEILPQTSANNTAIQTLNTYINTLPVPVIPLYTSFVSASALNTLYDAGDQTHLNTIGNRFVAEKFFGVLKDKTTISQNFTPTMNSQGWSEQVNYNGAQIYQQRNSNAGVSAMLGYRQVTNSATGFLNTYGSNFTGVSGYANNTALLNDQSGLILGGTGASGVMKFLLGGSSVTSNLILNLTTTQSTLNTDLLSVRPQNGGSVIQMQNATSNTAAKAGIRALSSSTGIRMEALSAGFTTAGVYQANDGVIQVVGSGNRLVLAADDATNGGMVFSVGSAATTAAIRGTINSSGRWRLGDNTTATAVLHLAPGTATASTAPLKFTSGTNLTTAEAGVMEYDGTVFTLSPSTTRYRVMIGLTGSVTEDVASIASQTTSSPATITVTGAAVGDPVYVGVSAITAGTIFTAQVTATNTVTVYITNPTSGAIDPPSAVYSVRVIKTP